MVHNRGTCAERVSDACQWALPDRDNVPLTARKDPLACANELDMCAREKVLLRRVVEGDDRFGQVLDRACKATFECIAEGTVYPVLAILSNLVWHSLCLVWELEPQKMFSKAHLRSEKVDLESKFVQVNDSFDDARARFLKEITVLRDQIRRLDSQWLVQIASVVYEEEPVMYYEPLMYFSEPMRVHIAEIVEEKLKQALMKLRKLTDFREDGLAREDAAKRFEKLYEESQATVFKLEAQLSHLQQECSRAEAEMCSLTTKALEEWKEVSNAMSELSASSRLTSDIPGRSSLIGERHAPTQGVQTDADYELPPDVPLTFSSPTGFSHVRPGDFETSICSRSEYTAKALKRLSLDTLESIRSLKEANATLNAQGASNCQRGSDKGDIEDAVDAARRREQAMMSKALLEKDEELRKALQKVKELEQEVARLQAIIDRLQAAGLIASDGEGLGFGGLCWKTPHGGVFERLYQDALDRKERYRHLVSTLQQARENGVLKIFNTSLLHYASYDLPEIEDSGRTAFMDAISFPSGNINIERDWASHGAVDPGSAWPRKAQEERPLFTSAVASHACSEIVQTISFPPEQRISISSPPEQQINKTQKEIAHHNQGQISGAHTVAMTCHALEAKLNSAKTNNLPRKPFAAVQGRPASPVMEGSIATSMDDSVMSDCRMKVLGRHLGVAQLNTSASEDACPKELALEKKTLEPVIKESCKLGFTSTLALACSRSSPNWQVSAASVWRPPLQKVVNVDGSRPSSALRPNSLTRPRSATGLPSVGKLDRSLHNELTSSANVGVQPLVALLGTSGASPASRSRPSSAGLSRQTVAQPMSIQLSGSTKKLTIRSTANNGR